MKNLTVLQKQEIISKNQTLENARQQLKAEFIGIDKVIDRIIDMCRAWYIFPDLQQKPTVINLWGMTGVGKTSLVNRLSKLIGFEKKLIPFDLGESSSASWSGQREFRDLLKKNRNSPLVLMFDEFQHAKTINETQNEIDRPNSRTVWEIIDTGKYKVIDHEGELWPLSEIISLLEVAVSKGVKVKDGYVIRGSRIFCSIFEDIRIRRMQSKVSLKWKKKMVKFLPNTAVDLIKSLFQARFYSEAVINSTFDKFNEKETITFLKEMYEEAMKPKLYDCSKSLIFILGNLDEAYNMTKDLSVDISADAFYESASKINITNIKNALLNRFRAEQIARLGNNHIIYPAFNSAAFKSLIKLSLDKIAKTMSETIGLQLYFDPSIHEMLYDEGVCPSQGMRPLLSTINNLIESNLPKIIARIILQEIKCNSVHLAYHQEQINVSCRSNRKIIQVFSEPLELNLSKLRQPKRNDKQAITAVHESGHAVVYMALFNRLPERIVSVTADASADGFIQTKNMNGFRTLKDLNYEVAMLMAGYAAEVRIFGKDNLTAGVESDFSQATKLACYMVKTLGMGGKVGAFQVSDFRVNHFLHSDETINHEVQDILTKGLELANQMIEREKALLLQLSDYLSDNRIIKKKELAHLTETYSSIRLNQEESATHSSYFRDHLKKLVSEFQDHSLKSA